MEEDSIVAGLQQIALSDADCNRPRSAPTKVKQHEISDSDFETIECIGQGSYSQVFSAKHLPSGTTVALKKMSRQFIVKRSMEEQLKCEINVHRKLRHQHIVRLYSYYLTSASVVLVMEYCKNGTLRDRLEKMEKFDELRASRYARQTARALLYLHENNITHRDLKLENILLDGNGVVKIADFGWSREISGEGRATVCGTLDYLSPEMLLNSPHTSKTDVWSLGAVIVEMLSGKAPFFRDTEKDTLRAIRCEEPNIPLHLSESARSLVLQMLQKDPNIRPSMRDVLQHPWIQKRVV